MTTPKSELFVLGANGFVGREVVFEALRQGLRVKALVRNRAKAADLAAAGATLIEGNADRPADWIGEAAGCQAIIDLVQPALPRRIGVKQMQEIAGTRGANTRRTMAALEILPAADRPLLLAVSGLDDLAPDANGRVHDASPLRAKPAGFAHIGIAVRRILEQSQAAWSIAYLGTVYGPGKSFAAEIFPKIAKGKFRMAGTGRNRMPMVHVEDAARALVHLAVLPAERVNGQAFVVADGSNASLADFSGAAANLMGASSPRTIPVWLAKIAIGKVLVETLTRDLAVDPSGLRATGFAFRYPSYVEGLPPTLTRLGYGMPGKPRQSQHRWLLPLLFLAAMGAMLAENLLNFPLSVPAMKRLAHGLPLLDMRPWYSANSAYQLFDVLGSVGRSTYLRLLWSVDLLLPLLFALFLWTAIGRGRFRSMRWLGLAAGACDYAENIAITVLLLHYPDRLPALVVLASALTGLKWAAYLGSILLALPRTAPAIAGAKYFAPAVSPACLQIHSARW